MIWDRSTGTSFIPPKVLARSAVISKNTGTLGAHSISDWSNTGSVSFKLKKKKKKKTAVTNHLAFGSVCFDIVTLSSRRKRDRWTIIVVI